MTATRPAKQGARPRKEAFFVQVPTEDSTPRFFNATDKVGQPMPFTKWTATCAMRAKADTVAFSLLVPSKDGRAKLADKPIELPHGPLNRLERQAEKFAETLTTEQLIVELGEETHTLTLQRDASGLVNLEMLEGDDVVFELPKGAVRMSLYLRSPKVERVLGIGCISYLGKPGTPESIVHAASKNLYAMCNLFEFRFLAGMESVQVGAGPARHAVRRPLKQREVATVVPVRLFDAAGAAMVAQGSIKVEIDLENASQAPGRLLVKVTPDAAVETAFESYRQTCDNAIAAQLAAALGGEQEVQSFNIDIVLGELTEGQIERLAEAVATVVAMDMTPTVARPTPAA